MFYSPSTRGFYVRAIHGSAMPPDVVEVSHEQYAALLHGQAEGRQIVPGPDGVPILADDPAPIPPPPVVDVSFWQFMMAAWKLDFITHPQALAAVQSRIMPPAFAAAISRLPQAARQEAELKFAGIQRMLRADPLFDLVVVAKIATDEQIDGVFALAATIT